MKENTTKMKTTVRRMKRVLFAACILFSLVLVGKVQASAATLTMTIERFSTGGGFIEEPMVVEFTPGETYADVMQRVLKQKGYTYSSTTGGMGFYLQGIDNVDVGISNMPACVKTILDDRKTAITGNAEHAGGLYERSYTGGSGWMYYVNNQYVQGMSSVRPAQGDVTRFMFTLYYGTDLTGTLQDQVTFEPIKTYYTVADKSELVRLMGIVNQNRSLWQCVDGFTEAYADAVSVMAKMDATANDVNQSLQWLREIQQDLPAAPTSISFTESTVNLREGGASATLNVNMLPSYDSRIVTWSSSNTSVATVRNGVVTPVSVGTTTIRAATYNGLSASCTVSVTKESVPVTGVSLVPSELQLTTGGKTAALTYKVTPQGADVESVKWESDNKAVATVNSNGKVTSVGAGSTNIRCTVNGSQSAVCHVTVYAAAQSIGLNKTSVTLWVGGQTEKLVCTYTPADSYAEVKWTSDNEAVAKVSDDGTVTPISVGETTVRVKTEDGKTASCTVKVQASQRPEFISGMPSVTAKATSSTTVAVQWKEYSNAERYIVYRRTVGSGGFAQLASVTGLSYTDKIAKAGTSYYYTVKAASKKWGAEAFSKYDTNIQVKTPAGKVTVGKAAISSVSSAGYNKIKVTWKKVTNATGYIVYRATSSKGSYKAIKTITSGKTVSYTDSGLTAGKGYYYKVRAFAGSGSSRVNGTASTAKGTKPVPAKPTLKATAGSRKAALKWSKVSGASGYQVVYSTSKTSGYKTLKTITKGSTVSYTKTELTKGKTYYYRVRAYRTVSGKKVYGAYSNVKSVKVK